MKDLIIVGAGGHGRELLEWITDINLLTPTWNVLGFLDDDKNALYNTNCKLDIIGGVNNWKLYEHSCFAMGISTPIVKEKVSKRMIGEGAQFVSIIHPTCRIAYNATYGKGFVAYPDSFLCSNAHVGDFVTLLSSKISHDCIIGDYSTILSYVGLNGNTTVGKRVFIANHSTIVQGKKIGDDVNIGIGSVVINDINNREHVFGNPARTFLKK